jgi:hypothetical protein
MQSPTTLKRHAALVDKMASAQEIDLEEEMLRGKLDFGGLEDAVLRCTACTQPDTCEAWLAGATPDRDATPPSYCRNHALFAELKHGG